MRILYIVNDLSYFCAHRLALARRMRAEGHEVMVAAGMVDPRSASTLPEGTMLEALDIVKHRLAPVSDIALTWRLRGLISRWQPDVVHAITMKANLFGALALAGSATPGGRKPGLVMTFPGLGKVFEEGGGWRARLMRAVVVRLYRLANRRLRPLATVENHADGERIASLGIADRSRVSVILGAGLPLDRFVPVSRTGPLAVLFAGRLIAAKGVMLYLEAAKRIGQSRPDTAFVLAGPLEQGNPDSVPAELLERAGRDGTVRFVGNVDPDSMPALLQSADVVCVPTLLSEGLPRVVLEAMSCGCAVIVSDQPSLRQVISDGETGLLVPAMSADRLASAISSALSDPQATRAMGARAADAIRALPVGEPQVVEAFLELYGEAAGRL